MLHNAKKGRAGDAALPHYVHAAGSGGEARSDRKSLALQDRRQLGKSRGRGPVYALKLEAKTDRAGIRSLRQLLKVLGRYHSLVCLDAREVSQ